MGKFLGGVSKGVRNLKLQVPPQSCVRTVFHNGNSHFSHFLGIRVRVE